MIKILSLAFVSVFILSCSKAKVENLVKEGVIKKYSIIYTSNSYANLIVFDNNDTIYLSNNIQSDINKYTKLKSDEETIREIREVIESHLTYKSLLVERDFVLHSGYLEVAITKENQKIIMMQSKVNTDLRVSKRFYEMIENLKKNHKEIRTVF